MQQPKCDTAKLSPKHKKTTTAAAAGVIFNI
jgi:hypothetical protein